VGGEGEEAFYQHRAGQGPEETLDPLVMSKDGKGIVMRKEDPCEATKRAAERDGHKLKTHLSQGEKRKRKATVAAVYSIERQVRTPGSNPGRGRPEGGGTPSASAPQPGVGERRAQPEQVTEEVFEETRRRDPEGKRPRVMLVDAHEGSLGISTSR